MQNRLLTLALISFALLGGACDLLDEPCPEGYWRPRAMEECEPVPTFDAGTDAGLDAGADDAGAPVDAAPADAQVSDGGPPDGGPSDGAVADGAAADGAVDGSAPDAG